MLCLLNYLTLNRFIANMVNTTTLSRSTNPFRQSLMRCLPYAILLAGIFYLSGCAITPSEKAQAAIDATPSYQPVYVHRVPQLPAELKRVVVLPAYFTQRAGAFEADFDRMLIQELNSQNLFQVVAPSRNEIVRLLGNEQYSSAGELPHDTIHLLKSKYAADGILVTDITRYDPYSPIVIGIRSKLMLFEGMKILWEFDDVFDSGDMRVTSGAQRFENVQDTQSYPLNKPSSITRSPYRFGKYVTSTVFNTLPSR